MNTDFSGDVALVTGGAGGLGEATVRALVTAGCAVVIADMNDAKGEALAEELGDRVRYARTDVLDDATVTAAIETAQSLGTLRYAVTSHGGFGVADRVVNREGTPAPMEGFAKTVGLYLNGTYNIVRLVAAAVAAAEPNEDGERGAIVTTASIAAYEGQIGQTAYAAAKAGVVGLTLAAARDLSAAGIRVVCVAPGTMKTPIMESVGPEMLAKFEAAVPFPKRLGKPSEYGALVLHALTNPYLNGEVIRLDGAQRFGPR
ncbi:probable short-chain dehydrogenase [Janibacter sp. HTCC2649]|uniref:SDR family NAD(P)-dependent oxidoreductase n=1 Tax=Janibacter sp. HTCC2649 TaxID=313589 RepID=UPI0000670CD9|nr:SDR family NAD(P)-dependent oxidoreductase [Janibacter sp. HTCC2649]EAQ00619.1 probable short-chain dehydrogenase [Janibacter sp. HTCC2649]